MINSAYKCLKITLQVIKCSNPEKKYPKKTQVAVGISPLESFEGELIPIPLWWKPWWHPWWHLLYKLQC
jgi:hypothetical protein